MFCLPQLGCSATGYLVADYVNAVEAWLTYVHSLCTSLCCLAIRVMVREASYLQLCMKKRQA
jgi:hypothetical protein